VFIRRLICAVAALLLVAVPALAEQDEEYEFDFLEEEGYTGEWLELEALGIDFCLPEGWTQTEPQEGAAFAAAAGDGSASVSIRVAAEEVDDIEEWADQNMDSYEAVPGDYVDTIYVETDEVVTAWRIYGNKLLCFEFHRAGREALPLNFVLQVVSSANEIWTDDFGVYERADDADPFAG